MEQIRVLHCPIGSMNMGGIENMLMQIYRNIDRSKYQFDFVVHDYNKNAYEDEIESLGGRIYRVPFFSKKPMEHCKEFYRLLKNHPEYQIVHIHTTYAIMYPDVRIAKWLGRTVVLHSHNSYTQKNHLVLHALLKNSQANLADYHIACSNLAAKWMFSKKIVKEKKYIIWKNAVELKNFRFDNDIRNKIRRCYGIESDYILVGNVGRLSYQKNQKLLIDVFAEYYKKNDKVRLMLVGSGEDESMLKAYAVSKGVENYVIFAGMQKNVAEYMMAMDVFVLSSRYEGSALVLVEAQATGIPIISSTVDKIAKLSEDFWIIEDYSNIDMWIGYLDKAINVCRDRTEMYQVVCESGFDINTQIDAVTSFYDSFRG